MKISDFKKINDYLWEIPQSFRSDMKVPARVYTTEEMLQDILRDRSMGQLVNVATMPGIYKYALVMPDAHEGYGFPIGGVSAMDAEEGLISPGGIGYDINCGVRLLRSEKTYSEVKAHLEKLGQAVYNEVPSGVGKGGFLKLSFKDLDRVLSRGAEWLVEHEYGTEDDLLHIESGGVLVDADPTFVSSRAKSRGKGQLGTMGAGNHFVEFGRVEKIFDDDAAKALGLFQDQLTVLIHTGSRGLGHQIATDYIREMIGAMSKYGITLPDRELAAAPFTSREGQNYFKAMTCGANFAWANRQLITWEVRKAWKDVLGDSAGELKIVYDVAHNIAKLEEYDGRKLVVHRKGATRAFPPEHPETPAAYKHVGQPVLIPGSMGTGSYVLVGQEGAMKESFGSTCHGAGRTMSRSQARREISGEELKNKLEREGIVIQSGSWRGLAEEAPQAYKDVDAVVDIVHNAGIAKKVVRLRPAAVIKG